MRDACGDRIPAAHGHALAHGREDLKSGSVVKRAPDFHPWIKRRAIVQVEDLRVRRGRHPVAITEANQEQQ